MGGGENVNQKESGYVHERDAQYSRSPKEDSIHPGTNPDNDPGKETLSVDLPSRQYTKSKTSMLGEPPVYHGADDLLMHGEGIMGIVARRWNALNAPCDGFGW